MNLIYISPVRWESFSQRPHKFVTWFHETFGGEVLWVEPYPTRLPRFSDFSHVSGAPDIVLQNVPSWLTLIRVPALPLEPIVIFNFFNRWIWRNSFKKLLEFSKSKDAILVIGKPSVFAYEMLCAANLKSLYDIMDDFPEFYRGLSKQQLIKTEQLIVADVNFVSVSSQKLYEKWSLQREDVCLIKNGLDLSFFDGKDSNWAIKGSKIIGYLGTVGDWFDWELVNKIGCMYPDYEVRIIGPIYKRPPELLPKNVIVYPACPHAQAIKEMRNFTIGLIPFLQTELTAGVDPIKFYEYHALGLPVISTVFGEMLQHRGVPGLYMLDDGSDITSLVSQALCYRASSDEIKQFIKKNDWFLRFEPLVERFA